MTPAPNHRVLSRERLAQARLLADAGRNADARVELLCAADHPLLALAASGAVELSEDATAWRSPYGSPRSAPRRRMCPRC